MATSKCTFETIIDTYIDTHIHTHIDRDDHLVAFKDVDLLGPPPDILVVVLAVFAQFGVEVGVGKPVLPDPLFALRLELRAQLRQCERTRARTHTHTHIYTHTHTHTYTHTRIHTHLLRAAASALAPPLEPPRDNFAVKPLAVAHALNLLAGNIQVVAVNDHIAPSKVFQDS